MKMTAIFFPFCIREFGPRTKTNHESKKKIISNNNSNRRKTTFLEKQHDASYELPTRASPPPLVLASWQTPSAARRSLRSVASAEEGRNFDGGAHGVREVLPHVLVRRRVRRVVVRHPANAAG